MPETVPAVELGPQHELALWGRAGEERRPERHLDGGAGLDLAAYDGCMTSNRYAAAVAGGWREAQRVGIPGTPTLLLFDRFYVGGLTANQLDRLLARPPDQPGKVYSPISRPELR